MQQHTPGPWMRRPGTLSVQGSDGRLVANALCGTMRRTTVSTPERPRAEAEANATLMALAPDLLDALRWALDQIEDSLDPDHQAALAAAHALIARATSATTKE